MICEYCGHKNEKGVTVCKTCNAPLKAKEEPTTQKYRPFLYNGYMLWPEVDWASEKVTMHFWLGDRLVESISLTRLALQMLVPEGTSDTHIFWELFKVAQGEEEVLRVQELNKRYPATFEIRRVEHPDKEYWSSIDLEQLKEMYRKGKEDG
jgi:hypothetical protein